MRAGWLCGVELAYKSLDLCGLGNQLPREAHRTAEKMVGHVGRERQRDTLQGRTNTGIVKG